MTSDVRVTGVCSECDFEFTVETYADDGEFSLSLPLHDCSEGRP